MSNTEMTDLIKAQSEATVANIGACVKVAGMVIEALKEGHNIYKTKTEVDLKNRVEDRLTAESNSAIRKADLECEIARGKHDMELTSYAINSSVSGVEAGTKISSLREESQIDSLNKLLERTNLEKKLLAEGVSRELIDATLRKREESDLMSNPIYLRSLEMTHKVLALALEIEKRKEKNIVDLKEALNSVEIDGNLGYETPANTDFFTLSKNSVHTGEITKFFPTGRIRVTKNSFGRATIEYVSVPSEEGGYKPIVLETKLLDDNCKDPLLLDEFTIDGRKMSLKGLQGYVINCDNSDTVESIFRCEKPEEFYIPSNLREEIYRAVCQVRGRDYLCLKEKDELEEVYDTLSKGMAYRCKDQALKQFMTDEKDSFLSGAVEYVKGAMDFGSNVPIVGDIIKKYN